MYFWIPIGKNADNISDVVKEANRVGKYDQAMSRVNCDVFYIERTRCVNGNIYAGLDHGNVYVSSDGRVVLEGVVDLKPTNFLRLE